MLVEPVAASGKGLAPLVQARVPAGNENARKGGSSVKAETQPDFSDITGVIVDVQQNLDIISNLELQFSVHGASGTVMVTVRDEASGEVIREIPTKEALDLAAKLDAMVGLIFDQNG
jgi:flagellar protein FlaG